MTFSRQSIQADSAPYLLQQSIMDVMASAMEGIEEPLSSYIDRENLQRKLRQIKKVRSSVPRFLPCAIGCNLRHFQVLLNYPDGPTTPDDLEIPDQWLNYPDGEPFVIYDQKVNGQRVIIMGHLKDKRFWTIFGAIRLELGESCLRSWHTAPSIRRGQFR